MESERSAAAGLLNDIAKSGSRMALSGTAEADLMRLSNDPLLLASHLREQGRDEGKGPRELSRRTEPPSLLLLSRAQKDRNLVDRLTEFLDHRRTRQSSLSPVPFVATEMDRASAVTPDEEARENPGIVDSCRWRTTTVMVAALLAFAALVL